MNKKLLYVFIVVAVVLFLAVGVYITQKFRTAKLSVPQSQNQETTLDPLNATYLIDGAPVKLTDGKLQESAAPGSAETITTQVFGKPVYGDINGDGKNDAAVFLVRDGGGSGTFYYVVAALGSDHGAVGTNAIFLGDRIAPDTIQVANGIITVNYADRKTEDPMSTPPSIGVSKYIVTMNGMLFDTPTDIYPLPSGFAWNEKQSATMTSGEINTTSTLVGVEIKSQPIENITDLSAKSSPFSNYYKKKLTAAGWIEDNTLAAGGPGAEIIGYKNEGDYIILEYTSVFKNIEENSPETCPCNMTFSVFAGTTSGSKTVN